MVSHHWSQQAPRTLLCPKVRSNSWLSGGTWRCSTWCRLFRKCEYDNHRNTLQSLERHLLQRLGRRAEPLRKPEQKFVQRSLLLHHWSKCALGDLRCSSLQTICDLWLSRWRSTWCHLPRNHECHSQRKNLSIVVSHMAPFTRIQVGRPQPL